MNPRHMELLRKVDGNGVDYTGAVTGYDIRKVCKIMQKAHPRKDSHKTNGPMELVYTDLWNLSYQQQGEDARASASLLMISLA